MRRFHLFEWEDQRWLPAVFRNFITDHLHYGLTRRIREPINRQIASRLKEIAQRVKAEQIVDLCAGAGGPLPTIQRLMNHGLDEPLRVVLTDLYPNRDAFQRREAEGESWLTVRYESTDAFDVPIELAGLRTLFTALHHFTPNQVRLILQDAATKRQPIAIFEPLERSWLMALKIGAFAIYQSFFVTPKVGELTVGRFLLTYVLPLCPMIMLWDGVVSAMRTYKAEELEQIAREIGAIDYKWEAGGFENLGPLGFTAPTTYLVGYPTQTAA